MITATARVARRAQAPILPGRFGSSRYAWQRTSRRYARGGPRPVRARKGDVDAKCLRCGAPANPAVKGGTLRELRGFERRAPGRRGHREPYGHVHVDRAFCVRRMPGARRRPNDPAAWGGDIARSRRKGDG